MTKEIRKRSAQPAGANATDVIACCAPATAAHGYIRKKNGKPSGLFVYPTSAPRLRANDGSHINVGGYLVVPVHAPDNKTLRTLHFIPPDGGTKLSLPGATFKDGYFVVGNIAKSKRIYVAEGIGQAWAINKATGCAATVTFGVGRMMTVAQALRTKYPDATLVIVSDSGQERGSQRVAEAVGGQWVAMPEGTPKNYDVNDYALEYSPEDLAILLDTAESSEPEFTLPPPTTLEQLRSAKLTPPCIIENMLFQDVGVFIAPGGMGKTTMMLYIALHIVLGRDLFLLPVRKAGAVVIVTAEDSSEILTARLCKVADGMELKPAEMEKVLQRIRIVDVSGTGFRLTQVVGDVVVPSIQVDAVVKVCRAIEPVLIIFDPAISFGVGESRVNDAEQGLVEAGRRIRNELGCGVLYVHHTGKQNARDKTVDQYSGRGGSTFADGSRMVWVMQNLTPEELRDETGVALDFNVTGLRMALPKMSFCPKSDDILIIREGWVFKRVARLKNSKEAKLERSAEQVYRAIHVQFEKGNRHTQNTLMKECAFTPSLTQKQIKDSLAWLLTKDMVEYRQAPSTGKGGAHKYIHPLVTPPTNPSFDI